MPIPSGKYPKIKSILRPIGMTQRYMHLSPAALDSAIRLLDQPLAVQSFGDILETGRVSEGKING